MNVLALQLALSRVTLSVAQAADSEHAAEADRLFAIMLHDARVHVAREDGVVDVR